MQMNRHARRVIVDSIGLLQDEAAKAMTDLYREPTFEKVTEIIQKLDARMSFVNSAFHVAHEKQQQFHDYMGFRGFRKVNPTPTELERDLNQTDIT
jgi:pantoate kinase